MTPNHNTTQRNTTFFSSSSSLWHGCQIRDLLSARQEVQASQTFFFFLSRCNFHPRACEFSVFPYGRLFAAATRAPTGRRRLTRLNRCPPKIKPLCVPSRPSVSDRPRPRPPPPAPVLYLADASGAGGGGVA